MITVPAHRVKQFGVEFFSGVVLRQGYRPAGQVRGARAMAARDEPPGKGKQRANRARVNFFLCCEPFRVFAIGLKALRPP